MIEVLTWLNGILAVSVLWLSGFLVQASRERSRVEKALHAELQEMIKGLSEAHNEFVKEKAELGRKLSEHELRLSQLRPKQEKAAPFTNTWA